MNFIISVPRIFSKGKPTYDRIGTHMIWISCDILAMQSRSTQKLDFIQLSQSISRWWKYLANEENNSSQKQHQQQQQQQQFNRK